MAKTLDKIIAPLKKIQIQLEEFIDGQHLTIGKNNVALGELQNDILLAKLNITQAEKVRDNVQKLLA